MLLDSPTRALDEAVQRHRAAQSWDVAAAPSPATPGTAAVTPPAVGPVFGVVAVIAGAKVGNSSGGRAGVIAVEESAICQDYGAERNYQLVGGAGGVRTPSSVFALTDVEPFCWTRSVEVISNPSSHVYNDHPTCERRDTQTKRCRSNACADDSSVSLACQVAK